MPHEEFPEDDIFGEWSYLTYMAQHASKGAPLPVFWSMSEEKSGNFEKAMDDYIGMSGHNDADPLAEYEDPEDFEDPYAEEEWWASDTFFGSALQDSFDTMEDGNMEQGLDDVDDIVSSAIGSGQALAFGPSLVDPMRAAGSAIAGIGRNVLNLLTPGMEASAAGQQALAEGYREIGGDIANVVSGMTPPRYMGIDQPMTDEEINFARQLELEMAELSGSPGGQLAEMQAEKTAAAEAAAEAAAWQRTILEAFNTAYPNVASITDLMDPSGAALTMSDFQDWMNWDERKGKGDEDFINNLIEAGLLPKLPGWKESIGGKEDPPLGETQVVTEYGFKWYDNPITGARIHVSPERYEDEFKKQGYEESDIQEQIPAKPVTGGDTGEDVLKKISLTGQSPYDVATENLEARFFTTIYQQPGVGYATQAELDSLLGQTQILFFLEQGEKAWQNIDENDAPALEENYQTYLGEYLERPFAQRLDPKEGPDFYSLLNDVSRIFAKPQEEPRIETWTQEDKDKKIWVDGLFGEGKQTSRDALVKLGLTHGGMGYFSSQIHKAAQNQMDYYRRIGWSEEKVFAQMTKGMKKPQAPPTTATPPQVSYSDEPDY